MVRAKGLEPPRLTALVPKTSASTNSATPALLSHILHFENVHTAFYMEIIKRSKDFNKNLSFFLENGSKRPLETESLSQLWAEIHPFAPIIDI